jgi:hypothetical protein
MKAVPVLMGMMFFKENGLVHNLIVLREDKLKWEVVNKKKVVRMYLDLEHSHCSKYTIKLFVIKDTMIQTTTKL